MVDIIGLTVEQFQQLFPNREFRVVKEEGEDRMITADYKEDRYNFTIHEGKIAGFYLG